MSSETLWNRLTDNREDVTIKLAFYNTLFLVLLGICLAGVFALYQMLHMFLTPILWAILIGTVLFPLKRTVSSVLSGWLNRLDEQNRPLLLGVVLLPLDGVNCASNRIYDTAFSSHGYLYVIAYLLLKLFSFEGTFVYLLSAIGSGYSFADSILAFLTQRPIRMLATVYAVTYAAWIFVQDYDTLHSKKKFARTLSLPIWIVILAYCADFCGPFRVLVFAFSAIILGLISAGIIGKHIHSGVDSDQVSRDVQVVDNETELNKASEDTSPVVIEGSTDKESLVAEKVEGIKTALTERLDQSISSDTHLRIISALCLLLFAARHDFIIIILLVLFLFAIAKNIAEGTGATDSVKGTLSSLYSRIKGNVEKLVEVVVAGSLRKFVHILFTSDKFLISSLKSRIDFISSVVVMIILAFGLFFFIIFTLFQIHSETVHLAKLTSNVVSSNPEWLRNVMNYTEEQLNDPKIDGYVDQAYQQGRTWLASNIRQLADPKDTKRADELEEQAKLIVDHLYRMWEERQVPQPSEGVVANRPDYLNQLWSASNLHSLKGEITKIVKENIETIISIAQSLWTVVLLNLSLLSKVLASVLGLVLGFGFDLLNFFIEVIVFLTVVFYLLASSSDQWLPLHYVNEAIPHFKTHGNFNIAKAIETAISGVFVLSAKMSIFYGLYTYFVHVLFDLNIVFVPSLIASCLAAVPIVPPYSVAIFGVIELFLVRGEGTVTIFFLLCSIAPLMFADSAFYREVKSSHPYVTGLAVIGGIYWIGLQGAVIGPIILCCFLILIDVYAEFAERK